MSRWLNASNIHTSMNAPEEAGVQDVQMDDLACRLEHPVIKLPTFLIR